MKKILHRKHTVNENTIIHIFKMVIDVPTNLILVFRIFNQRWVRAGSWMPSRSPCWMFLYFDFAFQRSYLKICFLNSKVCVPALLCSNFCFAFLFHLPPRNIFLCAYILHVLQRIKMTLCCYHILNTLFLHPSLGIL